MAGTEKAIYQMHERETTAQAAADIQERESVWISGTDMTMLKEASGDTKFFYAANNTIADNRFLFRTDTTLVGSAASGAGEVVLGTGFNIAGGTFNANTHMGTGGVFTMSTTPNTYGFYVTDFNDSDNFRIRGFLDASGNGQIFLNDASEATPVFLDSAGSSIFAKGVEHGTADYVNFRTSDDTAAFYVTAADASDNFRMRGRLDGGSAILELYNDDNAIKVKLDAGGISSFSNGMTTTLGTFSGGVRSTYGTYTGAMVIDGATTLGSSTDSTRTTTGQVTQQPAFAATTGASEATLDSFAVAAGYAYIVTANVVSTGASAPPNVYELKYKVWRNAADNNTGATELSNLNSEGDATQDVLMDYDSGVCRLRIIGHASNTIHWVGQITYIGLDLQTYVVP